MKTVFIFFFFCVFLSFPAHAFDSENFIANEENVMFSSLLSPEDEVLPRCKAECPDKRSTCNVTCKVGQSANCGLTNDRFGVCTANCNCK